MTLPSHIKPYYRIAEFGEAFGVGHTKTYELINSGAVKAVKAGARTLITGESAYSWALSLPQVAPKQAA